MVDLHSHVLFGIDDGAENIEMTLEILKEAEKIGIEKIMATPHFSIGDNVEEFIRIRDERVKAVRDMIDTKGIDIKIKAGAEVYITDEVFGEDNLGRLTLGESRVILCEFKYHNLSPHTFLDYIDCIIDEGFIPLIAHVERYSFVRKNPGLIGALLSRNALLQVNAISLFTDEDEGDFARELYENKVIYTLGSDVHNVPSKRYKAVEKLGRIDNDYITRLLNSNPDCIFENKETERRWM
ncbi:MAG: tyrosine-protein phosphatase [Clostridia bacterium]